MSKIVIAAIVSISAATVQLPIDTTKYSANRAANATPEWVNKVYGPKDQITANLEMGSAIRFKRSGWAMGAWCVGGKTDYLVLTQNIGKDMKIADAVAADLNRSGSILSVAECKDKVSGKIAGAVVEKKGSKFPRIFQAWLPDTISGKLVPVEPKTVKCHSDEEIAE